FCFFFQAEDGIRDRTVTGVQTCALPISAGRAAGAFGPGAEAALDPGGGGRAARARCRGGAPTRGIGRRRPLAGPLRLGGRRGSRSEERRVGKERRWGGGRGR